MPGVPMIALKPHRSRGRMLAAGEEFFVRTGDEARVLRALGLAVDRPQEPKPSMPESESPGEEEAEGYRPTVESETVIEEDPTRVSGVTVTKKRTYKRRDMTAEE